MEKADKEARHYRQGMEYRTMKADKTVCHRSDLNRLPAGATLIKVLHKYSYEQISSIFLTYLAFNKYADFFLDAFGELYYLEAEYEKGKLSAGQIKACRQHFKTKEIIIKIRSKLVQCYPIYIRQEMT